MKTILLTRNQVTLVDDEDFEWLNQRKWYANFNEGKYRAVRGIYMGRDIFTGKPVVKTIHMAREIMQVSSDILVDHANRNTLDNQRKNLRLATPNQNAINSGNSDLYKGIYFCKTTQRWRAYLQRKFLGSFNTKDEAAITYNKAVKEEFGEFAFLNQIMKHRNLEERKSINLLT